jgi:hypothetical protein
MAFRTITARFPGTCRRCNGPIQAGTKIRHGGRGLTYHLAAQCNGKDTQVEEFDASPSDERSGGEFRTCAQGGRCEDYPCCGCDGLHGQDRSRQDTYSHDEEYWDRQAGHDFFSDDR